MALNLERDSVGVVVLGDYSGLKRVKMQVYRTDPRGPGRQRVAWKGG